MSARTPGGLRALVRVRSVREQDSRTGLASALAEERVAAAAVADLERLLVDLPAPAVTDITAFQGRQHTLQLIRTALSDARAALEGARQVATAARERWVSDRSRLEAVETIVERRAAAVRAERERRLVREQDEVAGELWRRQQTPSTAGGVS